MASVWEQRFAGFLRRALALKESSALELLPDLMPVFNVMADVTEFAMLRGEKYAGAQTNVAAVVGQGSAVQLRNVTNDRLIVCDHVLLTRPVAGHVGVAHGGLALANAVAAQLFDGRASPPTTQSYLEWETGAGHPAVGNWFTRISLLANETFTWNPRAVLLPGQALLFENETVNTGLAVSFVFRERAVNAAELSPL